MAKPVILIADDEKAIVDLIKLSLGEGEYEYIEAYDGEDVLKKAIEYKPKLILLDIMMPKIDGYEVCRRLRANPETKPIIVAMISAKKEEQDIMESIDVGAVSHITKPFNPYELKEQVEELMKIGK